MPRRSISSPSSVSCRKGSTSRIIGSKYGRKPSLAACAALPIAPVMVAFTATGAVCSRPVSRSMIAGRYCPMSSPITSSSASSAVHAARCVSGALISSMISGRKVACFAAHSSSSISQRHPSVMHDALRTTGSGSRIPLSTNGQSSPMCGRMYSEQPSTLTPNAIMAALRWPASPLCAYDCICSSSGGNTWLGGSSVASWSITRSARRAGLSSSGSSVSSSVAIGISCAMSGFARPRLCTRERLYWIVQTSELRHITRRSSSCSRFAAFRTKNSTRSERCVVSTGTSSMHRLSNTSRICRTPSVCAASRHCCSTCTICGTALCIAARSAESSVSRFSATLPSARTVVTRTSRLSGSCRLLANTPMMRGSCDVSAAPPSTNVSSTMKSTSRATSRCDAAGASALWYSHGRSDGHALLGSSLRAISATTRASPLRTGADCSCAIISSSLLLIPSRISTGCFVQDLVLLASRFRSSTAASWRTATSGEVAMISNRAGTLLGDLRYRVCSASVAAFTAAVSGTFACCSSACSSCTNAGCSVSLVALPRHTRTSILSTLHRRRQTSSARLPATIFYVVPFFMMTKTPAKITRGAY